MMTMAREGAFTVLLVLVLASVAYCVLAILIVARFRFPREPGGAFTPPVTVLKPLCGLEPKLFECLRSFCEQDYPAYQVVFGVLTVSVIWYFLAKMIQRSRGINVEYAFKEIPPE